MSRDTRPEGHHGKNNPPEPTKQGSKGLPDTVNDERTEAKRKPALLSRDMINRLRREGYDDLAEYLRELQQQGHKATIRHENK